MVTHYEEVTTVLWARDHLLAGCVSFTFFVFLAWLCAVFNEHHLKATLSEMVHDWSTAEGKIFIAALLLPAIFFLLSSYSYKLDNAGVRDHRWGHTFILTRHFVVNSGLVLVAFVPTVSTIETRAHDVEVWVHSVAASMAFVGFIAAELFVLVCHRRLKEVELMWRTRALSFMTACLVLLLAHKSLYTLEIVGKYSEAWTFRYEVLLGGGLVSQNQLVWYFSDEDPETRLKTSGFIGLSVVPYLGSAFVIGADFFSRANLYGLHWLALEAALSLIAYLVCHNAITQLRAWSQRGGEGEGAGAAPAYGAAAGAAA